MFKRVILWLYSNIIPIKVCRPIDTDRLCSQNDFLSCFNKCVITRSDAAKSCQIILCNKAVASNITRLLPDTRNDALEREKKCQEIWYMGGRGGEGGARRRSLQIYNRSIALSQPFSEYNTIWSFLKWILARFPLRFRAAADFVRLAKWHILRVRCRALQKLTTIAVHDEMGGGGGRIHPFKG